MTKIQIITEDRTTNTLYGDIKEALTQIQVGQAIVIDPNEYGASTGTVRSTYYKVKQTDLSEDFAATLKAKAIGNIFKIYKVK